MECIFCSIINGEKGAAFVYKDNEFVAFMDKYPINKGHTLIVPREHYRVITEMPLKKVGMLFALTAHISEAVVSALKADGFSIGQNNGEAANQLVPHVHVHIIPRFNNDSEKGKWPSRKLVSPEELEDTASSIRKLLKAEIEQLL